MTAKFYAILTNQGAARLANAAALGTKLNLTQMAVGDANGKLPTPDPAQTKLINQQRIAALNMLSVDQKNPSQIIAEQVIPENEGGWWIREIGLYDDTGVLIAVANCPETYKPLLQEGSGRTQTIRMLLIVSSTSAITLKIDPAVVLATRQYVDDKIIEVKGYADEKMRLHEQSRNHPDGTLTAKGFLQLNSSVESTSEQLAATPKAVKIAMDNANARMAKERNLADLPNPALARQNLSLGDSATKNVGKIAGTVAAGDDPRITGAVQNTRTVNGKPLSDDVVITSQNIFATSEFIPANADLNDYKNPGIYKQVANNLAATGKNYPLPVAGSLEIYGHAGITQVYRIYNTSRCYTRSFYGDTWGAWAKVYDDQNRPTSAELGALSISGGELTGGLIVPSIGQGGFAEQSISKAPIYQEINTNAASVFYPIVKQRFLQGNASWSIGTLVSEGNFWIYRQPESGAAAQFKFNKDGTFVPSNYANFDDRYLKRTEQYPVGAPIPWPQSVVPSGFLACNGQSFNKTTYPLLASAYPSGILPDLRGEFIRGLDAGRGVDSGRAVLSAQGDAIRNIKGDMRAGAASSANSQFIDELTTTGAFGVIAGNKSWTADAGAASGQPWGADFDASRVVPTASENRPRNIAFLYIVRAA